MTVKEDNLISGLRLYLSRQASSVPRYILEQIIYAMAAWIPTVIGIAFRAVAYRMILRMDGVAAIEAGVRLRFADRIRLRAKAYLDEQVYLHAGPGGIDIGEGTFVMHGSILHEYNFRQLPHSGIRIGSDSLIGEYNVLRGQGGIVIGNRVYTSPFVQIIAVNHRFDDPTRGFVEQGITAEGIVIEDDVWIGAGASILDGVRIGRGSVVAAGAVVTKNVAPGTLVGGVPARLIRDIGAVPETRADVEVFY